ncbi:MAG TPA: metal ABC transporter substrate-binding protein [Candidatus Saccharimonadales bacterium]|nr:metal ABC transporter substrate-binding protein [Candidatus Saccharimonadales bacterium]
MTWNRMLVPIVLALMVPVLAAGKTVQVVTTTTDLAAIASEIGGDKVNATSLARGDQDFHFVDAKPSLMVKLRRADLFVEIGKELEVGWVPNLLTGSRNPEIQPNTPGFVDASQYIHMLEVPSSVSRAAGDIHPQGNPHYYTDPANGIPMGQAILEGLERVDPADRAYFEGRFADFKTRLTAAVARWKARAAQLGLSGMKIVTYHRSWPYFAQAFGVQVVDFIEPKPGIPPTPSHLVELEEKMRSEAVKLIFVEPYFDPRMPEKVAHETGAKVVLMPASVGGDKEATDWFKLFDRELSLVAQALGKGA